MAESWREAIEHVLKEEDRPLHYSEISEIILSKGYYKTEGATPDATVNATIAASIKNKGVRSPFLKVDKGTFTLRKENQQSSESLTNEPASSSTTSAVLRNAQTASVEGETSDSVIRCLGMYWQRDLVIWKSEPKVFGKQQVNSKSVDFCSQLGIYILYDHHTVVYVGRSVDRPMGRRLFEHTNDRLGTRWNRFSWFGLLNVNDDGTLAKVSNIPITVTLPALIATLEALLIESLEPPQNRRRGDDFSVMEYIQDVDPEIKERDLQSTLRTIEQKLRGQA